MSVLGLYVHIPFCARRCAYCDFVSYPFVTDEVVFVALLQKELDLRIQAGCFEGKTIHSVYFGGGTPSLLSPSLLGDFLETLEKKKLLALPCEVTLEVNPETVTRRQLQSWEALPITRLSVGVQSFQRQYLLFLGRNTSCEAIHSALQTIREMGWKNWNMDLIYGLPLQDFSTWQDDIERALSYAPPHISIYSLTIEPGVPLSGFFHRHRRLFPSPDAQAYLFRLAEGMLSRAGYLHYEVSNFALPGFECRHNLIYWRNGEYVGLGPSAWTHLEGKREKNTRSLRRYAQRVQRGELPVVFREELPKGDKAFESIALALRTSRGVPVTVFSSPKGKRFLEHLIQEGLLYVREGCVYPSSRGYLLLHAILAEFFAQEETPQNA